ncbi:putative manganese transport transmembrane protein [Alicyclobacillus sacchari]|uniref:NRAMP family divalent metal transporter n=1 Tax=Alicyclobacillus sacchari TaxID=392010 RepID=UPI0023E8FD9C|nr:NRAMP family divalent metal transporter [Alicyclobacillus sacchari]GMA56389.1 putative manganese transport transmembrane protein [Alicyclobacillus sacchari]
MSKNVAWKEHDVVHHGPGDIHGAFGTVRVQDTGPRKGWKTRLLTLLAIMGPGLIVMVGDNDAGGVSTYAQAGQNYGTSLLWVLLLLVPVLIVNQEMVVRLGLVTRVGHAKLIFERFGKFWGAFSVIDLFLLNILTIVTEFIGVREAMAHFGVSPLISVVLVGVLLIAMTVTGSFRRWERFMYVMVAANFLVIPLAFMSHPEAGPVLQGFVVPGVAGGFTSNAMLLIIGIVGTTVAPWQLFFQQSNVIDKRLTSRWMAYERADTVIGSVVVVIGAAAIMACTAFAFHGTALSGHFVDAGGVIEGLSQHIGRVAGDLFAIVLLNASLIGAAAVTLSTSYAFGDVFGTDHSLHRSVKDGLSFYLIYAAIIAVSAGIVVIPHAPLGLITTGVQALAGILLPSATVFLLLLCNDRDVLGPWVNRPWLNAISILIVGVLVMLSLILAVTTFFPDVDVRLLSLAAAGVLLAGLAVAAAASLSRRRKAVVLAPLMGREARHAWQMPPVHELPKATWSPMKKLAMMTLRGYLLVAVVMLVIKIVELSLHH